MESGLHRLSANSAAQMEMHTAQDGAKDRDNRTGPSTAGENRRHLREASELLQLGDGTSHAVQE
jgi:hypothetical protein